MDQDRDIKRETELMQSIYEDLKGLSEEGRRSVLAFVVDALKVPGISLKDTSKRSDPSNGPDHSDSANGGSEFKTFAELNDAARPETNRQRALVAGYWLQVCERKDGFVSLDANNLLKDVGATITNITVAFDGLINTTPRLVLQIRKSGKSQQGRKLYKLTIVGVREVERMIRGEPRADE